ncbi:hypothetical protein AOL_s00091g33 [Orbilia oligospora ATCC 24927]|uniref:Uncharacterized protein n=1 Tax=Arthrobotrys oligospora (strain ATCC 24927 / CBS 115.81 / DSM 1491) TaxID=756982 RepID=G1XHY1_ARTOA|nr:hypothetical protein AOL_s00091g33 [Orbilia oligospora ATCC 24927]EGX47212.1 hypothetical protein AOL_s00091g33 [Orbilia oligospora ATCC 24927]
MWVSLVAAAGRHCLLQPGGRLPDQGFNIYAFHRYRAMRLRLNKHVLARPSDLTVKPNPPNDPVFIEYVIFTMLRDELNIFVQAEDLGFLAGSKSSLGRIDGNGFISEVEREIHLKLLDSRIRDSYRLSGNHKEFLLSESEKYLGMGAENLALLWDENSYEMRSSCYKLLWSDTRMSDQEITEKKNEGVDGANLLRKRLRDIEVAYLNERDKWGLRPVSQNFGWHTSILAEEGSGQLLNLKAVHIVEDGRVEAYLKVIGLFGFVLGYITIVAQGPPDRCIHRVERRSKVNVDYIYDYMLEMKPKERLAIPRGSINPRAQRDILGVAFADKHDEGSKAIDPTLVKVINKVKRYPETYIKIKWEDQVTWETRSDVRRILLHEKELCILKEEMGYKINSAKQAERWDFLIYYHSRRFEQQYKATDDKN